MHLRAGRSFVFNATNVLRQTRRQWIDLFADYQARIDVVYIEPPTTSTPQIGTSSLSAR